LGHHEGRSVCREGPTFFELCPIFLNYAQHIFPGGAKNFLGGASPPLVTGLAGGETVFALVSVILYSPA